MSNGLRVKSSLIYMNGGARPAQEDHALVLEDKRIFVVADGFGGPAPGATASKTACESVRGFLFKEAGDLEATMPFELRSYFSLAGNVLFNALIHANRKVKGLNKGKDVHERGGASVIAGFMDGDLLALANVGACSAWLFRGGEARELVVPRTYGRLRDPFHAESREEFQIPLMAVGIGEDLEPEIFEYRIEEGDWLLLHTDGVHALARQAILEHQRELLSQGRPLEEGISSVQKLLDGSQYLDNAAASLIIF